MALFLEACGVDPGELSLAAVKVRREVWLQHGRIDLVLEWKDTLVVGIENKVFATENIASDDKASATRNVTPDTKWQTMYYAKWLPERYPDVPYHLVFLTRTGKPAMSDEFRALSYPQLVRALRCVELPASVTTRARVLWEDLLEHLEVYVMPNPKHTEFSEKALLYLEHQDMIRDLTSNLEEEWVDTIATIEARLRAHLDEGLWKTSFRPDAGWYLVYKPAWLAPQHSIYFQYLLSPANLKPGQPGTLRFMAQIEEGKLTDRFIALFAQRRADLEGQYSRHSIKHDRPESPPKRKAFAYKEYPIEPDIETIARIFIEAWEEFQFLTPEIDGVLAQLQIEQGASA